MFRLRGRGGVGWNIGAQIRGDGQLNGSGYQLVITITVILDKTTIVFSTG